MFTLKKSNLKLLMINFLIILLSATAISCDDAKFQEFENKLGVIHISDRRIILTQNHIAGIKSERYQPSLTLYGYLIPMKQTLISSTQRIKLVEVMVKNNQRVKKNQPLVKYLTAPAPSEIITRQTVNTETVSDTKHKENDGFDYYKTSTNSHNNKGVPLLTDKTKKLTTPQNTQLAEVLPENVPSIKNSEKKNSESQSDSVDQALNTHQVYNADLVELEYGTKTPSLTSSSNTVITAPFQGILQQVYYQQERVFHSFMPTILEKDQPILIIRSEDDWRFVSILPKYTESQLSIGQHVNFAVVLNDNSIPNGDNSKNSISQAVTLTGQISSIKPTASGRSISIGIHVVPVKNRQFQLKQGMKVQGKVNYGQMAVGTLVDKEGVHHIKEHDVYSGLETDLSVFTKTNANVVAPVKAFVWVVGQDRKLRYQIVDVIRYDAQTGQYLVAGIPNDVLICLVSLPKSTEGKIVKIS